MCAVLCTLCVRCVFAVWRPVVGVRWCVRGVAVVGAAWWSVLTSFCTRCAVRGVLASFCTWCVRGVYAVVVLVRSSLAFSYRFSYRFSYLLL